MTRGGARPGAGRKADIHRHRAAGENKLCEQCGKVFSRRRSDGRLTVITLWEKKRFCDQACAAEARQGIGPWLTSEVVRLYRAGNSQNRIASVLGVCKETVKRRLLREELAIRGIPEAMIVWAETEEFLKDKEYKPCGYCGKPVRQNWSKKRFCNRDCAQNNRCRNPLAAITRKEIGVSEAIATTDSSLSEAETLALKRHEAVIERGLKTFVEVGKSLDIIRESRLYRAEYATWEEYTRKRWGLSSKMCADYIHASRVCEFLREATPEVPPPQSIEAASSLYRLRDDPDALATAHRERSNPQSAEAAMVTEPHLGVSSGVKRDLAKREDWKNKTFRVETPTVSISMAEDEAAELAKLAEKWELSLAETARRLVVKGLKQHGRAEVKTA